MTTSSDEFGRPTRIDFLDGTFELRTYACCGLGSQTDRLGIQTVNTYDAFGRVTDVARAGITTHTDYDAEGRVLKVTRIGNDTSQMVQTTRHYDLAGRLVWSKDAINRTTNFSEVVDGSGQTVRTTTNPDGGTVVEVFAQDGSRLSVSGTAAAPHNYAYGVDAGGVYGTDTAVGQDSNGQPTTTEWIKNYTDFAGRSYKTVYADAATQQSYYNALGQLERQVDPDGVTTLFSYNTRGEQEVTAVDLNGNNTIDFTGTDRITKTTSAVATKTVNGTDYTVRRKTTQIWETDAQDVGATVAVAEQRADGLRSWQTVRGLTTTTVTTYNGTGEQTTTTMAPDGTQTIQVSNNGRSVSNTVKTAANAQLAAVTYGYDPHGRLQTSTDARNGVTTYAYFADDQIQSVTTPDPDASKSGGGYDAQVTSYTYDIAARVETVTQPDTGVVTTTYWPTGATKRVSGIRT